MSFLLPRTSARAHERKLSRDRMQTRDLSECTLAQYHVVPPGKKRKLAKKNASFRFSRVSYPPAPDSAIYRDKGISMGISK
jgi:hypothetical protein